MKLWGGGKRKLDGGRAEPGLGLTPSGEISTLARVMHRYFAPLLSVALALAGLAPLATAEPLQLAPQQGLLLLRTGSLLQGTITRAGDRYYVALPDGEIRVKVSEVELFCRDLDEAYQLKAAGIKPGQAEEHLNLAEWCLRQKLLGYAARELVQARAENPRLPRLELVERYLRLAVDPVVVPESTATNPIARATGEELDQFVSNLPGGAVETFTNHIQPLLLNRCATASCHGPTAESSLRMERIATGRPPTRRITHRNLQVVLDCIDTQDPSASPLLTKPLNAHGGGNAPVFTQHDLAQYQQLVRWVNEIASQSPKPLPTSVQGNVAPLLQTMNPNQAVTPATATAPVDPATTTDALGWPVMPHVALDSPAESGVAESQESPAPKAPQRGAPVPEPASKDPFDPAIFNRQFSP